MTVQIMRTELHKSNKNIKYQNSITHIQCNLKTLCEKSLGQHIQHILHLFQKFPMLISKMLENFFKS